ncbi:MAG TPA: aminotransferase class V-fold PLP-dependent enzyme, partial [Gemmatimonadales bacterium]|nr:aminotransferase class V-fold PLP-dependent enzyme [Gemmatimonadales bacterium]
MTSSRREWLQGVGAIAVGVSLPKGSGAVPLPSFGSDFPRKDDFTIAEGFTYLNGAYTHPMPRAAAEASQRVATRRSTLVPSTGAQFSRPNGDPRAAFASLINAKPSELSLIPNTSTGENLVVEALGIPGGGDYNVVTDALHFDGALVHLYELKKRGLDLRVVTPRDGRIEMADLERVVDGKTRLIEVSLVAMYNGFQHDLKAVCDLAHAHGAYVYADVIQAVGAVPFDVRATGVDFAATASYKWLMGDFGIGFLYVREDLLDRVVRRMHWSYESAPDADIHQSPFDPQHGQVLTYTP